MTTTPSHIRLPEPPEPVTGWGGALARWLRFVPGGLKGAQARVATELGPLAGVRATYAKLTYLEDVPVDPLDRLRAVFLLAAIGQDPLAWGLTPATDVPRGLHVALAGVTAAGSHAVVAGSPCKRAPVLPGIPYPGPDGVPDLARVTRPSCN